MKKQGKVEGSPSRGNSPGKQVVCRSQLDKGYPSPAVPPLTCFVHQPTFLVCLCPLVAGHVRNMCLIPFLQEPQIFLCPAPTPAEHMSSHTLRRALLSAAGVLSGHSASSTCLRPGRRCCGGQASGHLEEQAGTKPALRLQVPHIQKRLLPGRPWGSWKKQGFWGLNISDFSGGMWGHLSEFLLRLNELMSLKVLNSAAGSKCCANVR